MSTRAKKNLQREKSSYNAKTPQTGTGKKPKASLETGSFRIIGGQWRSRRLNFPAIEGLRPTTDRVRETVFNWLNTEIQGSRVLDVFSGSGALGLEALSRGATSLLAIEKDKQAVKALQANIDLLIGSSQNAKTIKVQHADALTFLKHLKAGLSSLPENSNAESDSFDLVFLDPPFRKGLLEETLRLLDGHLSLKQGALIYVEREKEMPSIVFPRDWALLKEKIAGQVLYQLFRVNG
ncbi:MAG: 16S rRNA (guanine966-N2)-methyltransferase [Oleiphilaceae bacterium]|jgi:16S rRNA (guanine966-N2)-methyltransferase